MKAILKKLGITVGGLLAVFGMSSPGALVDNPASTAGIKETTPLYLKMFQADTDIIHDSRMDMIQSWHSSHQSHQSHWSHSSHRSHVSSRW